MFEIGQMVVCMNETWRPLRARGRPRTFPQKGLVYTIGGFREVAFETGVFFPFLVLEEFPPHISFCCRHFRPVKKTSIEVFKEALVTPPKVLEPI